MCNDLVAVSGSKFHRPDKGPAIYLSPSGARRTKDAFQTSTCAEGDGECWDDLGRGPFFRLDSNVGFWRWLLTHPGKLTWWRGTQPKQRLLVQRDLAAEGGAK